MINPKKRNAEAGVGAGVPVPSGVKKRKVDSNVKRVQNTIDKRKQPLGKAGGKKALFVNAGKKAKNAPKNETTASTTSGQSNEKTDWRKFKEDKRELKLKRKKSKDIYEICVEAKQIYEKLKCRRTEKKNELVQKLYNLVCGGDTIKKMVMAHDTARVVQCMLKFASPTLREEISEKLLPLAVDMCVSKYSHFCVLRMFKYGSPNIKSKLVDSFIGNIVKLACHSISSKILDHAYLNVANAQQKAHMRQEFYGELYKRSKDSNVKTLADTYKDTPNMKASILGSVKSNLEHVVNKKLVDSSLVHAIMLEYLRECEDETIEESVSTYAPLIPMMVTTEDGTRASIICFYKSTPKNRRAIIKTIKEYLVKICTHEQGHIFMIALINSLDDTKATKKAIYDHIHPELKTLIDNQWGRRVVEWLISPADTNCFHPSFIATIEEGLQYGKKDKEVRRKEIFEQIEEPITSAIVEQPSYWLSNKHIGLLTAEVLKKISSQNFQNAVKALTPVIANPQWTVLVEEVKETNKKTKDVESIIAEATVLRKNKTKENKEQQNHGKEESSTGVEVEPITCPGIEEAGMHVVLKKIIKHDKERLAQDSLADTFGSLLLEQLTNETVKYWVTVNRACFILVNISENNNDQVKQKLRDILRPHLSIMEKHPTSGSRLLLKKLEL